MAENEHLDQLFQCYNLARGGAEQWNNYRKANPEFIPDLIGADLHKRRLDCFNLRRADLREAHLDKAHLAYADLRDANLSQATLTHAILCCAKLCDTKLRRADLGNARLEDALLKRADLSKASLYNSKMERTDLRGANLSDAFLNGANLDNAKLVGADLAEANLEKTSLKQADLCDANMYNATLNGANLSKAKLHRADLRWATLRGTILVEAELNEAQLSEAHLNGANLTRANLTKTNLYNVDLDKAVVRRAIINETYLEKTNLREAIFCNSHIRDADLGGATMYKTDLSNATLDNVRLERASLIETNLEKAIFKGCFVYGISAWNLLGTPKEQTDTAITPFCKIPSESDESDPIITVDDFEVAQFIYLLFKAEKLKDVIDTVKSKLVLILGRFTPERKAVLDGIRENLRSFDFIPVLFDFDRIGSQTYMETVLTVALMARFVIADFTEPKRVLEEVPTIVKSTDVPVIPLMQAKKGGERIEDSTIQGLRISHISVLDTCWYTDKEELLRSLKRCVIDPADQFATKLEQKKQESFKHIVEEIKKERKEASRKNIETKKINKRKK